MTPNENTQAERYSFVCNAGCGVCAVKVKPFEYERTETLEGEHLGSKYRPQIVSACCGAEVHVYDNEADSWGAEVTLSDRAALSAPPAVPMQRIERLAQEIKRAAKAEDSLALVADFFRECAALPATPVAAVAQPAADLRNALWLDPECAESGCCQSLKFKADALAASPSCEQSAASATAGERESLVESPWICDCGIERLFPAPCGECGTDAKTAASAQMGHEHSGDWLSLMCDLDAMCTLARIHGITGKKDDETAVEAKKREIVTKWIALRENGRKS